MLDIDQATFGERYIVRRLILIILAAGHSISVHDGEEWALKLSKERKDVEAALASTDRDYLHVTDATGHGIGGFDLIWGNAEDGSELIADHSDNAYCNAVWHSVLGARA